MAYFLSILRLVIKTIRTCRTLQIWHVFVGDIVDELQEPHKGWPAGLGKRFGQGLAGFVPSAGIRSRKTKTTPLPLLKKNKNRGLGNLCSAISLSPYTILVETLQVEETEFVSIEVDSVVDAENNSVDINYADTGREKSK